MTHDERRGMLMRAGTVIGIVVGLLTIYAFAKAAADNSYVAKHDYQSDQVRDSAWKAGIRGQLDYVACRQDRPRLECLGRRP